MRSSSDWHADRCFIGEWCRSDHCREVFGVSISGDVGRHIRADESRACDRHEDQDLGVARAVVWNQAGAISRQSVWPCELRMKYRSRSHVWQILVCKSVTGRRSSSRTTVVRDVHAFLKLVFLVGVRPTRSSGRRPVFEQQFCKVMRAESEAKSAAHRVTDGRRRKAILVTER